MADAKAAAQGAEATTTESLSLLDQIVDQGKVGKDAETRERGKDLVKRFVEEVLEGSITVARDTEAMINARIAQIDHLLSLQLNEILHHPEFQRLEASWRGLKFLMSQSETGTMLKIKVLNVSQEGPAARPAARRGVRPERAVQEGLRGGVRRLRRHAVRRHDRRLLLRQERPGHGAPREDLQRRRRGARAVRLVGVRRPVQPREVHGPRPAARPGQDLRHDRIRPLEGLPATARIRATWRSPRRASSCANPTGARPCPIEAFNYEERVDGTNHDAYLLGQARPGRSPRTSTRRSPPTAGAPRSAAWRAVVSSRGCRSTTSAPKRASWS